MSFLPFSISQILDKKKLELTREYIVKKFFNLGYYAQYNSSNDSYCCSCPLCNEGSTGIGRIKRCFYYPDTNLIYCYHCGWSSKPLKWIMEVSGMSYDEVYNEVISGEYDFVSIDEFLKNSSQEIIKYPDIPQDSIDLNDKNQLRYFKNNKIIQSAWKYLKDRGIFTAPNTPEHWFVSLKDPIHRDRLIIPYYGSKNKVEFYQSRDITGDSDIRYLSKAGGVKSIFNFNNLNYNLSEYFIFEGPFDSCFIENGVAVGGITPNKAKFNAKQQDQINMILDMDRIWVLDSQYKDETALLKTKSLLEDGESVFIWPEQDGKLYKDVNEMILDKKITGISKDYILKNTYSGYQGIFKLETI